MAPQYVQPCGDVVDAIFELDGRDRFVVADREYLSRQKGGVESVAKSERDENDGGEQSSVHVGRQDIKLILILEPQLDCVA